MADPLLQRIARADADEAARQQRVGEIINAVHLALQAQPIAQIIEIHGGIRVDALDRPQGDFAGGMTLVFHVPGFPIAYRLVLPGATVDQLHELLHSPDPATAVESSNGNGEPADDA